MQPLALVTCKKAKPNLLAQEACFALPPHNNQHHQTAGWATKASGTLKECRTAWNRHSALYRPNCSKRFGSTTVNTAKMLERSRNCWEGPTDQRVSLLLTKETLAAALLYALASSHVALARSQCSSLAAQVWLFHSMPSFYL